MAVAIANRRSASSAELFRTLVQRQVRIRRKRSWFGVFWPVVAPLFLLALYAFVFNSVFQVPIHDYPVFLFAGLLPWTFLAQTLPLSVTSLTREPELIRRAPFRYELLPISSVAVMLLYFLATLAGFIVYLAARGDLDVVVLPMIVVPIAALFLLVASISMVLSLVDVYNHDLRQVLGNVITIWFFLIPIVYRQDMAPDAMLFLRSIDPMNMIVGQFRDILYFGQISRPGHMVLMLAVCAALFAVGLVVFRSLAPQLPKDV